MKITREKRERENIHTTSITMNALIEAVDKHGCPCKPPSDVDVVVGQWPGTGEKKLEIVKSEIRCLKVVLGIKNKSLVFGRRKVDVLINDLKYVLV